MKSSHIEKILDDAAYKVVWGDYEPKYEHIAEYYLPHTAMDPTWDPFTLFELELMALAARKKYGLLPEQD